MRTPPTYADLPAEARDRCLWLAEHGVPVPEEALDHVARRVADDDIDPAGFHDVHADLSPPTALERLRQSAPEDEDLVLCHGHYLPNAVIATSAGCCSDLES